MLHALWFLFLLPANINAVQSQIPLADSEDDWNLNTLPNPNATGHLVFDTVSSLLQNWPNTRYYSGHTIVPGTIPTGTLLYHGRNDTDVPTAQEWVSTDPEFARLFNAEPGNSWLLTLVTTRPLRVLYFDGTSAAKKPDGPMDVQDLLSWGAVIPERATIGWEYERLHRLCDLADTLGIDAFVRRIMLCNFTEGAQIQTLSRLEDEALLPHHAYSFIHSSAWHDHYPGETRIHLDLTHLISLYDVALAPSLVSRRYGQARRDNRVLGIDARDTAAVLARVREIPFNSMLTPSASGIDWRALFQVIRDRYATRLEVLQSILLEDATPDRAFVLVQTALAPYRVHAAVPPPTGSDTAWAAPVFRLCASAHTMFIQSIQPKLTASERLLLAAAQATSREICRTLVSMWAEGVLVLRDSATLSNSNSLTPKWRADVERLIDWLGWAVWVKCRPVCAFDELCYLPAAPFLGTTGTCRDRAVFGYLSPTLLSGKMDYVGAPRSHK
ncbi:hypothetical protein B0H13DRAFT_1609262 [Mycena leptocephala]|nr:hypothetical protein B0H13DRAFT_1609262 [Mycena leptocephala]